MVVGGSGVGKTERLMPLEVMPDVVLESSITGPAALLSGTGKKERAKDATGGLLRKVPEGGGVLLLKDFTSIIDMHRDARAEVLAALREIYDGRWDAVRRGGRRPNIDVARASRTHRGLYHGDRLCARRDVRHGTRFLFVRLQGDLDIAGSAFEHVGARTRCAKSSGRPCRTPRTPTRHESTRRRARPNHRDRQVRREARSPINAINEATLSWSWIRRRPPHRQDAGAALAGVWLLGLRRRRRLGAGQRVGMDSIPKLRRAVLDYLAGCSWRRRRPTGRGG